MQASPSKARAQAITSHSWSVVQAWLARLYHPSPVPAFERNASTLKALQSLMAENIAADRERELLFDAKAEELAAEEEAACLLQQQQQQQQRLQRETGDDENSASSILSLLETSLASPAQAALDSLTGSVVLLGCLSPPPPPPPPPSSSSSSSTTPGVLQILASQIVNIPRQTFAQESQFSSIETLTANLQSQITQTQQALATFVERTSPSARPEDDTTPPSFPPTTPSSTPPPLTTMTATTTTTPSTTDYSHLRGLTLQHQRETKQLTLKSAEYRSRIAALERQQQLASSAPEDEPSLTALAAKQSSLGRKKKQIEALESRIRHFYGLPPDIDASRAEVQRAQAELDRLRRRRDELFEAM
ncbi:uncharacterized protein A1O5_03447 [Cladophialophora psammophila CBS 110553]|uniref:Uncharacterized protein n=1 Tax=Cladophialophora psammophila CBS 110553 TaxID=1182543 RepID=W9X8M9_9EURO|nr:uncharacterized protein A1O5_03447 [Cladophialophora psammophila CBS 110553]EXJ73685.1 hypothetical protein A1O5_03447 [Cladophialophora psammophila CBS 110553]